MKRFFILLIGIGLLTTACGVTKKSTRDTIAFTGTWQSDPVRFVRGNIDETYRFYLSAGDQRMDVVYHSTGSREDERTVRQALTVSIDDSSGKLVLAGAMPQLISGPGFVGEYAPDVLYCDQNKASTDTLQCLWGSDAHGEVPVVVLRPGN